MTVHPNTQLLRDLIAAINSQDPKAVAAQFTPDAVWWTPISAHERGLVARPVEGSAELAEMVTTVAGHLYDTDRTWTIERVLADDETGVVHVEMDTKLNGNGQPFHNSYAFVYRFENGRIAEVWEYVDTERAHKLFEKAGIAAFVNSA